MIRRFTHYSDTVLYCVAALISILLSTWINIRETVINPDAICYLLSAETIGQSGIAAGMQYCPQAMWPFYSLLISLLAKFTHLSFLWSAYLIDSAFTVISVVTFIAIIKALGGSKRVLWLAAAVILLSHQFNSVRQYIVRDHGFWAFYLVSLWCLLHYFQKPRLLSALLWSISLCVATLFRIEGAIFLLLLPFLTWFQTSYSIRQRVNAFLSLNLITLFTIVSLVAWLLLHPAPSLTKLGRLPEVINQLQGGLSMMVERYQAMRFSLATNVLNMEAARDASLVLVLTLIFWYLINVVGNLSWIYTALVGYAWTTKVTSFKRPAYLVVLGYLLVNLIVTTVFFAEHLFLAKRYLIAFSLVLMLWVPFALDYLIQYRAKYRTWLAITSVLIGISAISGIFNFGYSKTYLQTAGVWLSENTPENSAVYANDIQLMYYSKRNRADLFSKIKRYHAIITIADGRWKDYDFIALRLGHNENKQTLAIVNQINLTPIKAYANERGDKVVIYQIPHGEKRS